MSRTARAVVAGTFVLGVSVLGAAPALAQVCDPYSGNCTEVLSNTADLSPAAPQQTAVQPAVVPSAERETAGAGPAALPFTGGETVLIGVLGAAALATGAGLVVAGRRRPATA